MVYFLRFLGHFSDKTAFPKLGSVLAMDILTRERSRRRKVSKALSHFLSRSFIPEPPESEELKWPEPVLSAVETWTLTLPVLLMSIASFLLIFNLCRTRRSRVVSRIEGDQRVFEEPEVDDGHGQVEVAPPSQRTPPASPNRARSPSRRPEPKTMSSDRDMAVLINWIDRKGPDFSSSLFEDIERELLGQ